MDGIVMRRSDCSHLQHYEQEQWFSEVAASIFGLVIDFIVDFNNTLAVAVINFVKEVVDSGWEVRRPAPLRAPIVARLVAHTVT
jgi:hypothetical protein